MPAKLKPKNCIYCKKKISRLVRNRQKYCDKKCCILAFRGKFNQYNVIEDTVEIYIKDYTVLIDLKKLEKIKEYRWYIASNGYASTTRNAKMIQLHKLITGKMEGMVTDHINRNKLDNRTCNLRLVTQQINSRNSKSTRNNSSGHKGVIWSNSDNRWIARINMNNKQIHLGQFIVKEEAIKCRKDGELKYWGQNY